MPSRKKAKGKARKARANASNLILHNDNVCRHGCEPISKEDSCYQLVKQFEVELNAIYRSSNRIFQFGDLYNDTIERLDTQFNRLNEDISSENCVIDTKKRLLHLFVCLGTNLLLKGDHHSTNMASVVAIGALMSQHRFNRKLAFETKARRLRMRDLEDGVIYDAVKLFYKKSPCQCLKKMYYRLKPLSRTAICYNCSVEKDRKFLLYLCNGCHYRMYCCIHCQAADWPDHKEWCRKQT